MASSINLTRPDFVFDALATDSIVLGSSNFARLLALIDSIHTIFPLKAFTLTMLGVDEFEFKLNFVSGPNFRQQFISSTQAAKFLPPAVYWPDAFLQILRELSPHLRALTRDLGLVSATITYL